MLLEFINRIHFKTLVLKLYAGLWMLDAAAGLINRVIIKKININSDYFINLCKNFFINIYGQFHKINLTSYTISDIMYKIIMNDRGAFFISKRVESTELYDDR